MMDTRLTQPEIVAKRKSTYAEKQAERLAYNPNLAKRIEDYENVPTKARPAFILLGRAKGSNAYMGYVENSFSLGVSKNETFVYWTSANASSNFGGKFSIDGKSWAEKDLADMRRRHCDEEWEIFNVEDPLPVELDWRMYHWGHERDNQTLSGVRDKYAARNVKFKMLDDPAKAA